MFGGLSVLLYKPWRRRIDKKRVSNAHFEPLSQDQEAMGPSEEDDVPGPDTAHTKDVNVTVEPIEATNVAGPAHR